MKRKDLGIMLIAFGAALGTAGDAAAGDDRIPQGPMPHGPVARGHSTARQPLFHPSMAREPGPTGHAGANPARPGEFDRTTAPDTRRGGLERHAEVGPRLSQPDRHESFEHGPHQLGGDPEHRRFARAGERFGRGYEHPGHDVRPVEEQFGQNESDRYRDRSGDSSYGGRGYQGRPRGFDPRDERPQFEHRPYGVGYARGYGSSREFYGSRYGYAPVHQRVAHGITYRRYAGYESPYQPSYSYAPYGYPASNEGYASSGYAGGGLVEGMLGQGLLGQGLFSQDYGASGQGDAADGYAHPMIDGDAARCTYGGTYLPQ